jgi:hypothetical protein
MLPNTYNDPAFLAEGLIVSTITGDVPLQLVSPPLGVGARNYAVYGTEVPEAPIDKDRDPL